MMAPVLLGAVAALCGIALYGRQRQRSLADALGARMEAERQPLVPTHYTAAEQNGLPAPVQRNFKAVLREGQPMICAALLEQAGTMDMGGTRARWKPFVAEQRVVTRRPGFDWCARIAMLPGLAVAKCTRLRPVRLFAN